MKMLLKRVKQFPSDLQNSSAFFPSRQHLNDAPSHSRTNMASDVSRVLKALSIFGHGRPILHEPLTLSPTGFPAEDDPTAEDDALVSGEAPAVIAGIRPEVAAILETRAGELLLAGPVAPLRVQYLLAWSLLLARLRSLPATSSVYEKLVQ